MATERQILANRRNGALSRGPKTPEGKARSSRNALRHGLSIPATLHLALAGKIETLAQELAQPRGSNWAGHLVAAEAELELARVRAACEAAIDRAAVPEARDVEDDAGLRRGLTELEKLDRYERRALSKRKRAMRAL